MTHDSFTLVCLLMQGHANYSVEYVEKLRSMVARNTTKKFETVVLTDGKFAIPKDFRSIVIEPLPGRAWWSKLRLFDPAMPFSGRMFYLDLDILVTGELDSFIDYPADFAITRCSAAGWQGRGFKRVHKLYNSSVMAFNAGCRPQLFTSFDRVMVQKYWSDQDFIGLTCPDEAMFPAEWTTRLSQGNPDTWHEETRIVLSIHQKPHIAVKHLPWVADYWR